MVVLNVNVLLLLNLENYFWTSGLSGKNKQETPKRSFLLIIFLKFALSFLGDKWYNMGNGFGSVAQLVRAPAS